MSGIEIKHDTGYGLVPRRVMRDDSLSVTAKAVYAYLASFAGNTGRSFPSTGLMAKELNLNKNTLFKYLNELKEKEVITVERERGESNKFGKNVYYLHNEVNNKAENSPCPNSSDMETSYMETPDMETSYMKNYDTNSNNLNSNNLNSNKVNSKASPTKVEPPIPYKEIIDYLNAKAKRQFRNVYGNQKHIKARWNEGYRLDDFKRVIDTKVNDWKKEKKMHRFIRPETLFGPKFDSYLNEGGVMSETKRTQEEIREKAIGKDLFDYMP